jgi:hypothetical protein
MEKKVLTTYRKLPREVKNALKKKYPLGFENILTTIKMISNGESISALIYNYEDTQYLIKYTRNKKIDSKDNSEETEADHHEEEDELTIF